MAKLILLRHLQSQWNKENRFNGWIDTPLLEGQSAIAEKLAKKIFQSNKIDVIYCSRLFRNMDTVARILEYDKKYPLFIHLDIGKMRKKGNFKDLSEEEELKLIDAGVEDIEREDGITLYTKAVDFKKIKERVEALKLPILEADLEYVAKKRIKPKNEASLINLYEALEDCDDVNNFYTNAEL